MSSSDVLVASNALIKVTPGLMIWTIVAFLITLFVLKRYAFGPIQKTIDERRQRIEQSIHEAEEARNEARRLLEEHRALIGQARGGKPYHFVLNRVDDLMNYISSPYSALPLTADTLP